LCHLLSDFHAILNVSFFFLKSEETKTSIDFHRLCEHTEMVPRIGPEVLIAHLCQFIDACKVVAKDKLLLNPERLDLKQVVVSRHLGESLRTNDVFCSALCVLAHTPRTLKHALRRGWMTWCKMPGEVDLLELLVCVLLREGCPAGYQFTKQNLSELRSLPKEIGSEVAKNMAIIKVCEMIAGLGLTTEMEQSLKVVLIICGFKVSLYNKESYYTSMTGRDSQTGGNLPGALQSVASDEPTDYFRRLEAGEIDANETPDQTYVSAIQRYVRCREGELVEKLSTDTMWGSKLEQFKALFPKQRIVDLIEDHVRASGMLRKGAARSESPGFSSLRELMRTFRDNEDREFLDRLEAILVLALKYSLELAHSVYYEFTYGYDNMSKTHLRDAWVLRMREFVETDGSYLAYALDPSFPYALYHTLRFRNDFPSFNDASDWQWLAGHLCQSLDKYPEQMAPDVARLFIHDNRGPSGGRGKWYELDRAYFEGMCATDDIRSRISVLLLAYADGHSENDPTAFSIRYVRADLEKYGASGFSV